MQSNVRITVSVNSVFNSLAEQAEHMNNYLVLVKRNQRSEQAVRTSAFADYHVARRNLEDFRFQLRSPDREVWINTIEQRTARMHDDLEDVVPGIPHSFLEMLERLVDAENPDEVGAAVHINDLALTAVGFYNTCRFLNQSIVAELKEELRTASKPALSLLS